MPVPVPPGSHASQRFGLLLSGGGLIVSWPGAAAMLSRPIRQVPDRRAGRSVKAQP